MTGPWHVSPQSEAESSRLTGVHKQDPSVECGIRCKLRLDSYQSFRISKDTHHSNTQVGSRS